MQHSAESNHDVTFPRNSYFHYFNSNFLKMKQVRQLSNVAGRLSPPKPFSLPLNMIVTVNDAHVVHIYIVSQIEVHKTPLHSLCNLKSQQYQNTFISSSKSLYASQGFTGEYQHFTRYIFLLKYSLHTNTTFCSLSTDLTTVYI